MDQVELAAKSILNQAKDVPRLMVAIAGPPGAGKSTLSTRLAGLLPDSIVVPADGYHFDDIVLEARGWRSRKGAPHTFDVGGLEAVLKRIRAREPEVAIPIFDRDLELSRAAAAVVKDEAKIVLVEGLYLLLDAAPWSTLAPLFDYSIFIDVPRDELVRRLRQRWAEHGRADAENWIQTNDIPNIDTVLQNRLPANLTI